MENGKFLLILSWLRKKSVNFEQYTVESKKVLSDFKGFILFFFFSLGKLYTFAIEIYHINACSIRKHGGPSWDGGKCTGLVIRTSGLGPGTIPLLCLRPYKVSSFVFLCLGSMALVSPFGDQPSPPPPRASYHHFHCAGAEARVSQGETVTCG